MSTLLVHRLANPITGLYFNGTNFSATRAMAKIFLFDPCLPVLNATWPGAVIETVPANDGQCCQILRERLRGRRAVADYCGCTETIAELGMKFASADQLRVTITAGDFKWHVEVSDFNDAALPLISFSFETRTAAICALDVIAREAGI